MLLLLEAFLAAASCCKVISVCLTLALRMTNARPPISTTNCARDTRTHAVAGAEDARAVALDRDGATP